MSFTKRYIKIISAVFLLTTFLTWFFYAHETLPKPIRAATAIIETPVAIASGLSHYLKLGVDVYESPTAIIISNFIASIIVVILAVKLLKWRRRNR
jgi:uncharacterized membrane protein YqhA